MTHPNSSQLETFNLFCRAVLIILVDSEGIEERGKTQFLLQTFKIDLNTTFVELKKGILNFYDLNERENDFILKFIDEDGETTNVRNDDEIVDAFLKGKSNMKKAKFLFMPKSLSKYNC